MIPAARRPRIYTGIAALLAVGVLAGCAGGPATAVDERVDERTAVTVATLPRALVFSGTRGTLGQPLDLSLGPVEINRMGTKRWYLWAALAGGDLRTGDPHLRLYAAGTRLVDLAPAPVDFRPPVSHAPYPRPADWVTERWYEISAEQLAGLRGQRGVVAELAPAEGDALRFEPWDPALGGLDEFVSSQLSTQLAAH